MICRNVDLARTNPFPLRVPRYFAPGETAWRRPTGLGQVLPAAGRTPARDGFGRDRSVTWITRQRPCRNTTDVRWRISPRAPADACRYCFFRISPAGRVIPASMAGGSELRTLRTLSGRYDELIQRRRSPQPVGSAPGELVEAGTGSAIAAPRCIHTWLPVVPAG